MRFAGASSRSAWAFGLGTGWRRMRRCAIDRAAVSEQAYRPGRCGQGVHRLLTRPPGGGGRRPVGLLRPDTARGLLKSIARRVSDGRPGSRRWRWRRTTGAGRERRGRQGSPITPRTQKVNFQFDRMITGWRNRPVLDLRLEVPYVCASWRGPPRRAFSTPRTACSRQQMERGDARQLVASSRCRVGRRTAIVQKAAGLSAPVPAVEPTVAITFKLPVSTVRAIRAYAPAQRTLPRTGGCRRFLDTFRQPRG